MLPDVGVVYIYIFFFFMHVAVDTEPEPAVRGAVKIVLSCQSFALSLKTVHFCA